MGIAWSFGLGWGSGCFPFYIEFGKSNGLGLVDVVVSAPLRQGQELYSLMVGLGLGEVRRAAAVQALSGSVAMYLLWASDLVRAMMRLF